MSGGGDSGTPSAVRGNLRRLVGALGDWEQRAARAAQVMASLDPECASYVFDHAMAAAPFREEADKVLAHALFLALIRGLWNVPHTTYTREAAAGQHNAFTTAFLVMPRIPPFDEESHRVPDYGERPLTLGERKSLARRQSRSLLDRLLRDPHPQVVARLLRNPRITTGDVVRVCARRTTPPAVLSTVAADARWRVDNQVQRALVANPETPEEFGVTLLPFVDKAAWRQVAACGRDTAVTRAAQLLLRGHLS